MTTDIQKGVYAANAEEYFTKGWSPIPWEIKYNGDNPKGTKKPGPVGITGHTGRLVTLTDIQQWTRPTSRYANFNVGIRMPQEVIGIDVDHYDDKTGGDTLKELEARLGPLPSTVISTSRDDGISGIRLFRVPAGFEWKGEAGKEIEIAQFKHRFVSAYPSLHPTGRQYKWVNTDWEEIEIPHIDDIPELPQTWINYLVDGLWGETSEQETRSNEEAEALLASLREGPMCSVVRDRTDHWKEKIEHSGARHPAALKGALSLMRFAGEGHAGVGDALKELEDAYDIALGGERDANAEFEVMMKTAAAKVDWTNQTCTCGEDQNPDSPKFVAFTDTVLAQELADDEFKGKIIWSAEMDWLRWNGKVWEKVTEVAIGEVIRKWALYKVQQAAENGDPNEITKRTKVLSAARQGALYKLVKGIVEKPGSIFDVKYDFLNAPNGMVDLRSGEILAHDSNYYFTKITNIAYEPNAESKVFDKVLEAVPEDSMEWLQVRIGQAATGHTTDRMVVLTGEGSNGKTLLMGGAIYSALGGFASKVPNELLLKGKSIGGPTPEKMALRGVRLAYFEETPEDGFLNTQVVKELVDAVVVEGRNLYKNTLEWKPTYSMFLNTNHPPTVTDTGHGAWRRLSRVIFPYRYRLPGQPVELPDDRVGDPNIKSKLASEEAQKAALAWIVGGAIKWYENERVMPQDPQSVQGAMQAWRLEADVILQFVQEVCTVDINRWVPSIELYGAYKQWAQDNGNRPMSNKEFMKRLKEHSELPHVISKVVRASTDGVSRWSEFGTHGELKSTVKAIVGLAIS